jgi:hypothetical protein
MTISADAILGRGEYQKEKSTGGEILNKKGRKNNHKCKGK